MIDNGITAFYNDDIVNLKLEFKSEFNRLVEEKNIGLHTFIFSSYHEYIVNSEILHCMMYDDTVLFFVTPCNLYINLDHTLNVIGGGVNSNGNTFELMFVDGDTPDVVYIGECCNSKGFIYGIYTFTYKKSLDLAVTKVDSDAYNAEILVIDDQYIIDVSMDYIDHRIERFQEQVDRSFELDEPLAGLDENPYSNEFYDDDGRRISRTGPLTQSRKLGDYND